MTLDLSRAYRMARAHAGIRSLDDLSGTSGLSRAYLTKLSTGSVNPTLASLVKLASGCGVTVSRLLRWAEGED